MRIIGGEFSGRRFNPPTNTPARPTTDVAKEALFNILDNLIDLDGIKALELFAGTGSISYELASRGAAEITLIERDPGNLTFIKKTAAALGITDRFNIVRGDVFKFLQKNTEQYDFIFADPPYALENIDDIPMLIFEKKLLVPGGIFVQEHAPRNDYQKHPNFIRMKNYGSTVFTFFKQPSE
ncbi:MAG: 16S rRNA (guanine(966)-N(2))-methyltransferase RsmD [Flavipsychrobacter sp.]|nr:16S rRNA (guanine(966)-N(2))-methyltransferase RsmD [Flavipsychrobacter sp.]